MFITWGRPAAHTHGKNEIELRFGFIPILSSFPHGPDADWCTAVVQKCVAPACYLNCKGKTYARFAAIFGMSYNVWDVIRRFVYAVNPFPSEICSNSWVLMFNPWRESLEKPVLCQHFNFVAVTLHGSPNNSFLVLAAPWKENRRNVVFLNILTKNETWDVIYWIHLPNSRPYVSICHQIWIASLNSLPHLSFILERTGVLNWKIGL